MRYEVEQKFQVDDLDAVLRRLEQLGARAQPAVVQIDHYLGHPCRSFAETDEAFRLRRAGEANCVTYKGPRIDATTKTRREVELALLPGAEAAERWLELLAALGFERVADVRKRRREVRVDWEGDAIAVALDEVEGAGTFVELETAAGESDLDPARRRLASLAERLGLTRNERRSYLELVESKTRSR